MPSNTVAEAFKRNILIFGESGVGKTCFNDMFVKGKHFALYEPFPASDDTESKLISVNDRLWCLNLLDLNASLFKDEDSTMNAALITQMISNADGIVLLYDVTRQASFDYITWDGYLELARNRKRARDDGELYPCGRQRFGCVLVGNKRDLAAEKRQVAKEAGEDWAASQGMNFFEVASSDRSAIEKVMEALVRSIERAENWDREDIEEEIKKREEQIHIPVREVGTDEIGRRDAGESRMLEEKSVNQRSRVFPKLGEALRKVLRKRPSQGEDTG
ncbi:P-loop containing nucleoside triphosphate hydrolase protein [Lojkania enalia]|uniref:P-loop containing nucleoside triphosphate hydrolase protein n=1 Tax=Lojkania enalia TaxID=147567 RepID=A0A9P4NBA8_9PLEO|nr:P-loop containing nucleoside triphosphate hydrolase protein [Didymosphaeria enalia]